MDLILERNSFHYEMEKLCRLFYPMQRIRVFENGETPPDPEPLTVVVGVRAQEGATCLYARVTQQNTTDTVEQRYDGPDIERALAVLLYGLLEKSSGFTPQWGILTGIRPVKLLRSLVAGCGESQALRDFQADYLVSSQKTKLAQVTMHNEQQWIQSVCGHSILPEPLRLLFLCLDHGGAHHGTDPGLSRRSVRGIARHGRCCARFRSCVAVGLYRRGDAHHLDRGAARPAFGGGWTII